MAFTLRIEKENPKKEINLRELLNNCKLDYGSRNQFYVKNSNNGKIGAFYTLTEDCLSIFPIKAKTFINLDNIQIDDEFIRFYIYSEDRVGDGIFLYSRFMECVMMAELEYFDSEHIIIPPLSKEQMKGLWSYYKRCKSANCKKAQVKFVLQHYKPHS